MGGWMCFAIACVLVWPSSNQESLPWKLNSVTSCFGSCGDPCFLNPGCTAGERIVVDNIYALAKPKGDNCPSEMTVEYPSQSHCCEYANDCLDQYNGAERLSYFETFTGRERNAMGKPTANQRVSNACASVGDALMEFSNFMMLNYYCINQRLIATFNDDDKPVTASVVYLFNTEYPGVINNTMTSSITCSVTPSCGSSIVITAIDISLHSDSTGCLQSLHVVDGSTVKTFTCDDNNQYDFRTIYTSSSHFVKVTFNSNVTADAGKLWIQFNASNPRAVLNLSCGDGALSTPPPIVPCPATETDSPPDYLAIAVAIPVIFLLWVILPVVIFCCESKIRKIDTFVQKDKVAPAHNSKQDGFQDPLFTKTLNIYQQSETEPNSSPLTSLDSEPRGEGVGQLSPVNEPGNSSSLRNNHHQDDFQSLEHDSILLPIGTVEQTPPQKTLLPL